MAAADYVLGDSQRELARLEKQAGFYAEPTRDGLLKAGLAPGMRVLDLGCGAGDVSLIAAGIVGEAGQVTGIDVSEPAVAISRMRAAHARVRAQFEQHAVESFPRYGEFDAVIGRFILVHMPDPAAVLRTIARSTRPGTLIVSMEMDMSTASASTPFPLMATQVANICRMYAGMGLTPDMGARLFATYRAAGLSPRLTAFTPMGDRTQTAGFDFLVESVRSLIPAMEKLGITTASEIDVDTLGDRLADEAAATDPAIYYPRFTVAWART